MYIPYANFPEGHTINVVSDFPILFEQVELKDFVQALPMRFYDFIASHSFINAAPYQDNTMTSLIMLLSAVERTVAAHHKPLDWCLLSKDFRVKMEATKSGAEAHRLLKEEIERLSQTQGSMNAIVSFFTDHLSNQDKLQIIRGIHLAHKFKKKAVKGGTLYEPIHEPSPLISEQDTEAINLALKKRLKGVVYEVRNGFVHRAETNPFGNKKYIEQNHIYEHEVKRAGEPKEAWVITMTFEKLHGLTVTAFQSFWLEEYGVVSKKDSSRA